VQTSTGFKDDMTVLINDEHFINIPITAEPAMAAAPSETQTSK